jgi:hypothetical protein
MLHGVTVRNHSSFPGKNVVTKMLDCLNSSQGQLLNMCLRSRRFWVRSPVESPILFKDKFVSADTDQSPQIRLDLEQTVTKYYSFPSSKVLNGQEKKDEVLTLGNLSLSLLILALPQCSCVVQSQQHKPITAKTLIYSKL